MCIWRHKSTNIKAWAVKIKYIHWQNKSKYGSPPANSKLLLFSKRRGKIVQNFLKDVNRVVQSSLFCTWPAQHILDLASPNTLLKFLLWSYQEANKQTEMPTYKPSQVPPSLWADHTADQRCHAQLLPAPQAAHISLHTCSGDGTFGGKRGHRKVETSVSTFANVQELCSEHGSLDAFM